MATTISAAELAVLCRSGKPIDLIDVRTPAEFENAHVERARNVPLERLDGAAIERERVGRADEPVYLICQKGGRGQQACEKLAAAGMANVVNVAGGTDACAAAGMQLVYGRKTMSLERQVRIAAGSLVLVGSLLGYFASPYWIGLAAFIGAGLVFAGVTDTCGMGLLLARMPWNQRGASSNSCALSNRPKQQASS
jgi:rhodanese-related sulfurtransferase